MRGEIYFIGGITLLYCCDTVIKLVQFVTRHSRFDMQAQVVSGLVVLGMALMGVATNDLGRYVGLLFTLMGLAWLLVDLRQRGKLDKRWE